MTQTYSLHPFVALAPIFGLVALVMVHILLTHLSRGKMHLASLALALGVGFFVTEGIAFYGISKMYFFSGESPFSLYCSVGIAILALGYGYFTFVNLNTTSLRIRILREILLAPAHSIRLELLEAKYDAKTVTAARIQRLTTWGQLRINNGAATLRKHLFWLLAGTLSVIREILLPSRRLKEMAERIGKKGPRLQRKALLCALLTLLIIGSLFSFYQTGIQNELNQNVTERTRFHAIPIALAQIFHQSPHDYTGWKKISQPFQDSDDLGGRIQNAITQELEVDQRQTYFWIADDRGSSDLTHLSFRLFGFNIQGLYNGYFLIIVISVIFFILTFRRDPLSLSVLLLFICAYGSFLPEISSIIATSSLMHSNYRIHLSESRTFEILGLLFALQVLIAIVRSTRFDVISLTGVAAQAFLFGFLLSCRSSLGWIVLALIVICVGTPIYLFFINRRSASRNFRSLVWAAFGICIAFAGMQTVKAWHRLAEHPYYLSTGAARTFYHNAIVGLSTFEDIRNRLNLPAIGGDRGSIEVVNQWLSTKNRKTYNTDALLNALGGYGYADWRRYEGDAKDFYWDLWRKTPLVMIKHYIKNSLHALEMVKVTIANKVIPLGSSEPIITQPNPLGFPWMIFALIPLAVIFWFSRDASIIFLGLFVLLAFALIPSVAFYASILTVTGGAVILRLICYLALILTFAAMFSLNGSERSRWWLYLTIFVAGAIFLSFILIQQPVLINGNL